MKTKFSTRMLALALILTLLVPMLVFHVSAAEESATITFNDKAKRTVFADTQQVWEENGITVTNDKASSQTKMGDYANPVRFYQGSKITVAFNQPITKIVFDCGDSSYATELKNSISGATISADKVTVTLNSPATSFTVDKLVKQVRVDSVTVYYAAAQGGEPTPSINISGDGDLQIGEPMKLTATTENITGDIVWSSSDETVATVDGGVVTGKKLGKATITASIGEVQATHEVTVYPKANSTITVGEALELANFDGGSVTPYTYYITGTVKSIDTAYSTEYKNITVTIGDDTGSISVFRMKGGRTILVGQKIIVCGKLNTYGGKPQVSEGSTYELVLNDSAKPIVEALNKLDVKMSLAYRYETSVETVTKPASTSDKLNLAFTGIPAEQTGYADWSDKTDASGAVYAGQSARGNSSIQLRSKNSNSGIVSTTSGGKIQSIKVTWNSATDNGRTLDIYGKNEAYNAASELYNTSGSSSKQGTKIASLTYSADGGATQTVTIEGDYAYIGIRSNDGAQYVDSIEIEWANGSGETESVETFYKNSSFALRFGVDKALVDIEGITSYGIMVSAGDKEVYFSTKANSWTVDDKYCHVTVDLGDIINNLTKLSTEFTAKVYVEVEDKKYFSEKEATYSVVDMVKEYHALDIAAVEPFYEYLVENGLINVGGN